MSDEPQSKKFKQITDILGQENMPDIYKGLLSLLAGSNSQNQPEEPKPVDLVPRKETAR
jgi:hypothetical protein